MTVDLEDQRTWEVVLASWDAAEQLLRRILSEIDPPEGFADDTD